MLFPFSRPSYVILNIISQNCSYFIVFFGKSLDISSEKIKKSLVNFHKNSVKTYTGGEIYGIVVCGKGSFARE